MKREERYVEIDEKGTKYKVWTQQFGDHPNIKILFLHGGPGSNSLTFEVYHEYMKDTGYEYYLYDQLGSFRSDQPEDDSLWTIERFVEEVEQVRKSLGLNKNNFVILGNSWGGMLGMEYALKYQENLKALIISSMQASIPDYVQYENEVLAKEIDPAIIVELKELEKTGADPERFDRLMQPFYEKFVLRCPMDNWPAPLKKMMKTFNRHVYTLMNGPTEFGCSGVIKDWDVKARLHEIKVPTLVVGSTYNTMDPDQMRWMASEMPHGEYLHCPNGGHMFHWDDSDNYFSGLFDFLGRL